MDQPVVKQKASPGPDWLQSVKHVWTVQSEQALKRYFSCTQVESPPLLLSAHLRNHLRFLLRQLIQSYRNFLYFHERHIAQCERRKAAHAAALQQGFYQTCYKPEEARWGHLAHSPQSKRLLLQCCLSFPGRWVHTPTRVSPLAPCHSSPLFHVEAHGVNQQLLVPETLHMFPGLLFHLKLTQEQHEFDSTNANQQS